MKQKYMNVVFRGARLVLIAVINEIIEEYRMLGFTLTVRQLYYQLVARNYIPNNEKSYKSTTKLVNDAKLAGMIDWDMIEDRTRAFKGVQRWDSPQQILESSARYYHQDMWENQEERVFCIVEKEALFGVLERVCNKFDVRLLAARGYPSGTVLREFVQEEVLPNGAQRIHIIHLGDHDPSGIDMTRDLTERIATFCGGHVDDISLTRIALNMDQVEEKKPPPNPAKLTDSRAKGYMALYGRSSWELDALDPMYLEEIVQDEIVHRIDEAAWRRKEMEVFDVRARIRKLTELFE